MGNQICSVQSNFQTKHSEDEKCTASTDSNPNFEDLNEIQSQSIEGNKFAHFLDKNFKDKKIASKQIQFKIINQNDQPKKNLVLQEHIFLSNLEETQQILNQKSIFHSEIEDLNSFISQQSCLQVIDQNCPFYKSQGDKSSEKQELMTRSSFSSYTSKYKQMNIKQSNFVKVKNLKFQDFYENLQKIGQGATGHVFTARCKKTNQIRAVKVLKNKIMKRMSAKKTLNSELDMLKNFDHPSIIKVYDVFHTEDLYYVVTEYCSGGTLQEYVLNHKLIDQRLIKIILRQLLGALCYLHSLSIIHRDIKMDNIVFKTHPNLCQSLDDVQIKVIDFGLAKKAKFKSLNKDSPCLGTPLFMAPEIMKGYYSQKCDIWACGVIMHYLLFNYFPYSSGQIEEIYKKITSQQIDYTKPQWRKIPNDAKLLLQGMLQKNSACRINAYQALKSQWLSDRTENNGTKTQKNLVYQKLTSYKKENNFISIIESYIMFGKSTKSENYKKLIKLFHKFDENNNGCIEINELQQIVKENIFVDNKNIKCQIKQMIAKIDKNNSGKIEISEFLSLFVDRNQLFTEKSLQNAFEFFDQDKDGFINKKQLEKMLQGCDNDQIEDLWRDLDINDDNKISIDQFIKYIKRLNNQVVQIRSSTKSIKLNQQQ